MEQRRGPDEILQAHFSVALSRALSCAFQFRVFTHLAQGAMTAAQVAERAGISVRGAAMLLDVLVGAGFLARSGDGYRLTQLAEEYCVVGKPNYLGAVLEEEDFWTIWVGLPQAVRSGRPVRPSLHPEEAARFFGRLIRTLHPLNWGPASRAAAVLGATARGGRILDVGCGSCVWSIPLAMGDPTARVWAQDLPQVLEIAREYVERCGVASQYQFLPGDFRNLDFGEGRFDLVLLGNILHGEGEQGGRRLLARLGRSLKAGGRVAILDMIPRDDRTGPLFPLLFAFEMLLNTEQGGTFTQAEYTRWLREAGFQAPQAHDIQFHSPLLVAVKE